MTTLNMSSTDNGIVSQKVVSRRRFLRQACGTTLGLSCFHSSPKSSRLLAQVAYPPPAVNELTYWSAKSLASGIRNKLVSCEEAVTAHLNRIAHVNGKINAVVQLASERALAEARAADAALAQGQIKGPLHGVPITIKDSFDTEGIISTAGTIGRARLVPTQDATVVARLRTAGAILLGKTNTPEFTLAGVTDNLVYGRTNNPFDLVRTVGGSSGGAAATITVGGSPLDIGTDTLASIRWPAHCCGVAGIKPTSGRASLAGHILGPGGTLGSLTQPGPIARFVEDLIFILPIICGPDPRDVTVEDKPLGDPASVDLKSLRVAFHTNNGVTTPAAEIVQTVRASATSLSTSVAAVDEKVPPGLRDGPALALKMFEVAGRDFFSNLLDAAGTPLNEASSNLQYFANELPVLTAIQQADALAQRDAFKQGLLTFMQDYDVILCPVNSQIAPLHSQAVALDDPSYTEPYNLAGLPAAVIRAGISSQGLPIGVQIVGRPWAEHVVLAVAQFLETALGGWQPVPAPRLSVQRSLASWSISWKGYGTLQTATRIDGSWDELPQATSPYRVTNTSPYQFYRLRQ